MLIWSFSFLPVFAASILVKTPNLVREVFHLDSRLSLIKPSLSLVETPMLMYKAALSGGHAAFGGQTRVGSAFVWPSPRPILYPRAKMSGDCQSRENVGWSRLSNLRFILKPSSWASVKVNYRTIAVNHGVKVASTDIFAPGSVWRAQVRLG